MKKYLVEWIMTVEYSCSIELEAESAKEAREIFKNNPHPDDVNPEAGDGKDKNIKITLVRE